MPRKKLRICAAASKHSIALAAGLFCAVHITRNGTADFLLL